ncbi:ABC transporter permease [Phragmitibacter flavus]|uniref:Oligopeptide transport system permease protein OppC n=2 Tax=Phragmitibacter flavus TaxID=2576071 RepID=A0A5R8KJG7_9BACT|nr:ABC transporter permease [Phragmitibacter flavus]
MKSMSSNQSMTPTQLALRALAANRLALAGLVFLILMLLVCGIGPWFSPYLEEGTNLDYGARGPSAQHWMGTDVLGRDVATRLMHGGRISLAVGLVTSMVALVIGVGYGAVAGLLGGRVDAAMMRVVDVMYAFPLMIFVIILTMLLEKSEWLVGFSKAANFDARLLLLFLAIGAVEWLTMARMVRGQIQGLMRQDFLMCARANGARWPHIIQRHLLPNVLGPVIVYTSLTVPSVMILEATLSFLGLGVQPPFASWGSLILDGANSMETYPWLLIFPVIFFSLTLLALNFIGDGLRDVLDPRKS